MDEQDDYYALLGVAPDADQVTLKQAYRTRARQLHPDVQPRDPAATARFQAIVTAYQTLSDPVARQRYDASRRSASWWQPPPKGQTAAARPATPTDRSRRQPPAPHSLAELLTRLLTPFVLEVLPAAAAPARELPVAVNLEEAFWGTTRLIRSGHTALTVVLPPGVATGDQLQVILDGLTVSGSDTAQRVTVRVTVRPHPRYVRVGDDLWLVLPLDPALASRGGRLLVPTFDGTCDIIVPACTESGTIVRLLQQGMPRLTVPGTRGDLVVHLVVAPRAATPGPGGAIPSGRPTENGRPS